MTDPHEAFRRKVVEGTATVADYRRELARRIRCARAVTPADDPRRGYRKDANACRKSGRYARMFGIGKLPKPPRREGGQVNRATQPLRSEHAADDHDGG